MPRGYKTCSCPTHTSIKSLISIIFITSKDKEIWRFSCADQLTMLFVNVINCHGHVILKFITGTDDGATM